MKLRRYPLLFPALLILLLLLSTAALAEGLPENNLPLLLGTLDNVEAGETLAFVREGETLPVNNGTVDENAGTVELNGSTGLIQWNSGTVERNAAGGSILTNGCGAVITDNAGSVGRNFGGIYDPMTGEELAPPALISNNTGSVDDNMGIIENNSGEIKTNSESGVVQYNTGLIKDNGGAVLNAAGGVIERNSGTVYLDGGEVESNGGRIYVKIPIERDEHALVTDIIYWDDYDPDMLSAFQGEAWKRLDSGMSNNAYITFSPAAGYVIDKCVGRPAVNNGDGTWTIQADLSEMNGFSVNIRLHPLDVSVDVPAFGPADFVLPADLEGLGDSAFEGDALITAVDARHCSSIGRDTFKDTGLTQILLPKDCTIDSDAFAGCEKVYVYAPAGGETQTACGRIENCVFVEYTQN
ncbi:MAG: leucine-rich repeat domain-containing protein [Oscillospiraceae bacterium]|nr:leucine-rich repeat domain-containing protein [Oscillospiraceae bacterium]